MTNQKDKILIFASALIFFVLLIIAATVGCFIYTKQFRENYSQNLPSKSSSKECSVMIEDCRKDGCPFYFLCDTGKEIEKCTLYNCRGEYKAEIKEKDNTQIISKNYPRPNLAEINQRRENCIGKVNILSKQCQVGELRITANVSTQGECPVKDFLAKLDGIYYPAEFKKENENYIIKVKICGNLSELIAIAEGGVSIK